MRLVARGLKIEAVLTVAIALLIVPAGASAGVGIGGPSEDQSGVSQTDFHAPVTELNAASSVSAKRLARQGVKVSLRSDERVRGSVYLQAPDLVISGGKGSKASPLAKTSVVLEPDGEKRLRLRLTQRGMDMVRNNDLRQLMVLFTACDASGNQAAPLTAYIDLR